MEKGLPGGGHDDVKQLADCTVSKYVFPLIDRILLPQPIMLDISSENRCVVIAMPLKIKISLLICLFISPFFLSRSFIVPITALARLCILFHLSYVIDDIMASKCTKAFVFILCFWSFFFFFSQNHHLSHLTIYDLTSEINFL